MGLRDDLDDSSLSVSEMEMGIDNANVQLDIEDYLDEIEKKIQEKRNQIRSAPGSSQGFPPSSSASKIIMGSRDHLQGHRIASPNIRPHTATPSTHSDYTHFTPEARSSSELKNDNQFVTSITVESDPSSMMDHEPHFQLIWRNLTYLAKPKTWWTPGASGPRKVILEKQSGSISGGEITAVIGPSGAGKSTLLECLSGRRKTGLRGDVYVSFERISRESENIKVSLIGQKDDAIGVLTVREVLTYASRIKNYQKISNSYYTPRLVASVLDELSLEKCADTKVSKISGGQLKRLVFGVELISGPDIILLDEPTSGLDASSAYSCVKLLKKLTDLKKNIYNKDSFKTPAIICSIHQPSARVLNNFHKIYVLSSDGRCLYQGPPNRLLQHLARIGLNCPQFHNPADFIIEVASGDYGIEPINKLAIEEGDRQLQELKGEKIISIGNVKSGVAVGLSADRRVYMKIEKVVDKMKNKKFPILLHTYLLWKRTLITNLREPKLTWFRLFQAIFIALLMSFLYDYNIGEPDGCFYLDREIKSTEDNIAFIFFISLFTVMASMMPTVLTFPKEVAILLQERNNGWYSCACYYVAKIVAETPLQIIITLTFIAIIYPLTGQVMELNRFLLFALVSLLISSIAQCVGMLFGTYYVQSVENAVFLAPLSMAPVFLLSGFFGKLSAIPYLLKPIAYVSYVRYAFETLLIILYGFDRCPVYSPPLSINSLPNANIIASASEPRHLINTGWVSGNEISDMNQRTRKNLTRGFRIARNQGQLPWELNSITTVSPLELTTFSDSTLQFSSPPSLPPFNEGLGLFGNLSGLSSDSGLVSSSSSYVLKRFDVTQDMFLTNMIILISFLIFLRITCYIILLKKTNERR